VSLSSHQQFIVKGESKAFDSPLAFLALSLEMRLVAPEEPDILHV
jgi:hypothetical protein